MPALTQRAKRRLVDDLEDEGDSGDEQVVGILAQRAARQQAAREAARLVCLAITIIVFHVSDQATCLTFTLVH